MPRLNPVKVTSLKPNYDKLVQTSAKYDALYDEIYSKFSALQGETSQRITRNLEDKQFYLGDSSVHWGVTEEVGDIHPIVNYSATVINKYADLLTAGEIPGIQMISPNETKLMKAYASGGENLIYKILEENYFSKNLHYGAVNGSMLGDSFFHCYYDPDKEVGGKKGSAVVESISPFFIRVGFAQDNWDNIEYWISESRMTPSEIKRKYDISVDSAMNIPSKASGGSTVNAPFDGSPVETSKTYIPMATVLNYHDKEKDALLIGDQAIMVKENSGNHGLYHIRNRTAPNEPWGYPDHYNIKDTNILLNKHYGQAKEIIDNHAGPIIIDKGAVLQGKRIKKRANIVVTTSAWGPGEGLDYLQWNGNLFPITEQIRETTKTLFDLSEMPQAAFGSFQPGETSGFALTVQMQPTLMRVKIKQNAEWGPNMIEMFRYLLKLTLKNDKSIGLPEKVADFDIKIHWPNPLPREDAREIQNQVALISNRIVSKETARQNLLIEDTVEEEQKIEKEQLREAELAAESQVKGQEILQKAVPQQGQGETAVGQEIQPGQAPEQNFPRFAEEERATPQNLELEGGESIAETSKGL